MTRSRVLVIGAAVALAGSTVLAQATSGGQAGASAHAQITGKGITGTAEFVEHKQNIGTTVDITLTVSGLTKQ